MASINNKQYIVTVKFISGDTSNTWLHIKEPDSSLTDSKLENNSLTAITQGIVSFSADSNSNKSDRTAEITFTQDGGAVSSFTVTQKGDKSDNTKYVDSIDWSDANTYIEYTLSADKYSVEYTGGNITTTSDIKYSFKINYHTINSNGVEVSSTTIESGSIPISKSPYSESIIWGGGYNLYTPSAGGSASININKPRINIGANTSVLGCIYYVYGIFDVSDYQLNDFLSGYNLSKIKLITSSITSNQITIIQEANGSIKKVNGAPYFVLTSLSLNGLPATVEYSATSYNLGGMVLNGKICQDYYYLSATTNIYTEEIFTYVNYGIASTGVGSTFLTSAPWVTVDSDNGKLTFSENEDSANRYATIIARVGDIYCDVSSSESVDGDSYSVKLTGETSGMLTQKCDDTILYKFYIASGKTTGLTVTIGSLNYQGTQNAEFIQTIVSQSGKSGNYENYSDIVCESSNDNMFTKYSTYQNGNYYVLGVYVSENTSHYSRSGTITLYQKENPNGNHIVLTVVQEAKKDCKIVINFTDSIRHNRPILITDVSVTISNISSKYSDYIITGPEGSGQTGTNIYYPQTVYMEDGTELKDGGNYALWYWYDSGTDNFALAGLFQYHSAKTYTATFDYSTKTFDGEIVVTSSLEDSDSTESEVVE